MTTPGPAPHLVLAVGTRARTVAEELRRDSDRYRALDAADDAGPVLDEELARLSTGWRVLAVGLERDVLIVARAALARGALDEEITVLAVDQHDGDGTRRLRRVHCGHCHHQADLDAAVGDVLPCPGCGEPLSVTDHRSRIHGASLGVPTVP
ncbi:hypothetical protein LQ327_15660 [Actinomycetospora endophytica]|uniref:Dimethylamine monooxygenase subunit DmmA-like C-terminal domain-containing protein n=1 Tax=Actinomycetospora endophytica TaxID=2291215 RepID=A0ABS8P9A6_9PSEU|nr:dimethylamine monooxygenase subunit DmmA family protein [Actinomycetospora endophytica]MCD2194808.1 hypothetical protein [Actinomycetospora endophytica]